MENNTSQMITIKPFLILSNLTFTFMIHYLNRSINLIDTDQLKNLVDWLDKENSFVVGINWSDVWNKHFLYKYFGDIIWFPDYFWDNWDAFWDIITDEDFVNKDLVIVIKSYNELFHETKDGYEDEKIFARILLDLIQTTFIDTKIQIFFIKD